MNDTFSNAVYEQMETDTSMDGNNKCQKSGEGEWIGEDETEDEAEDETDYVGLGKIDCMLSLQSG